MMRKSLPVILLAVVTGTLFLLQIPVTAQDDDPPVDCDAEVIRAANLMDAARLAISNNDLQTALENSQEASSILILCQPDTSTLTPTTDYLATIDYQKQRINALEATLEASTSTREDTAPLPTLDPDLLPPPPGENPPQIFNGCVVYQVTAGDTCGSIAGQFNVDIEELIRLNGINPECTDLQIGQDLLIPETGCVVPPTFTPSPTPVSSPTVTPTITPQTQIDILDVQTPGQFQTEAVVLQNTGQTVNLNGWMLTDEAGNAYVFPEFRMVTGGILRLYTTTGQNTPAALYWNLNTALWQPGTTLLLFTDTGNLHTSYTLP